MRCRTPSCIQVAIKLNSPQGTLPQTMSCFIGLYLGKSLFQNRDYLSTYIYTIHKHLHQLSGPQECLKIWWSKSFCLCFYISAKIWSPSSSLFPTALPLLLTKVYLRASCYIFFYSSLMRSADELIFTSNY